MNTTTSTSTTVTNPVFAAMKPESRISFVLPYDPKSTAIEGYRYAVIRYRQTDSKVAAKPAKMVLIPQVTLPEHYFPIVEMFADSLNQEACAANEAANRMAQAASKVFLGIIEDQQDAIIKEVIETSSVISWDVVTLENCLSALTAVRTSSRLTKEGVENWARIAIKEACYQRAAIKSAELGHNAEQASKQREATLNAYVTLLGKLSAAVPNVGQESAQAADNLLKGANLDDDMARALLKKLNQLLNPVAANNGDL